MLTPALKALQWSLLPGSSRHRDGSKNHDERIDRPEVISFGMRDVVSERKEQEYDGKPHAQRGIALKDAPQPPEAQKGHSRVHKNVGRIERLLFEIGAIETPVACPHIDDAAKRHPDEPRAMAANVIVRLLKFVVHVSHFTGAFIFRKLCVAVVGMERAVHPVPGVAVVADVEFETVAAADRNKAVEGHIVPHQPGRERYEPGKSDGDHLSLPRPGEPVATAPGPNPEQGENKHHHRVAYR